LNLLKKSCEAASYKFPQRIYARRAWKLIIDQACLGEASAKTDRSIIVCVSLRVSAAKNKNLSTTMPDFNSKLKTKN
jgi:hypothetical protein